MGQNCGVGDGMFATPKTLKPIVNEDPGTKR